MTQIDITKDGQPWLTNQNTTNKAMWTRVQMAATAGRTLKIFPHVQAIPKPPNPPPAADLAVVRNLLILATVTDDLITLALQLPPKWKFVFSADPAYTASDSQIQRVKSAGRFTGSWGDCMTTLPPAIKAFAAARGLNNAYGQCENSTQFDVAYQGGLREMVGHADALTDSQLANVRTGNVKLTVENYRNVNPGERPDWKNANAGIGGNCGAVYGSATEGAVYTSARSQYMNGWFGSNDSWYCEAFQPADWQALKELG